jgi:hypothetical protein
MYCMSAELLPGAESALALAATAPLPPEVISIGRGASIPSSRDEAGGTVSPVTDSSEPQAAKVKMVASTAGAIREV